MPYTIIAPIEFATLTSNDATPSPDKFAETPLPQGVEQVVQVVAVSKIHLVVVLLKLHLSNNHLPQVKSKQSQCKLKLLEQNLFHQKRM